MSGRLPHASPLPNRVHAHEVEKYALVMVGLPARGKTYISRKIARYLSWLGYQSRVFNVGNYRRERLGSRQSHDFFDPDNPEGNEARLKIALAALDDMLGWMRGGGDVGIYDATNTTRERRELVRARCEAAGYRVVFIESICTDSTIVDANVRETKLRMPDYHGMDPDEAVADFKNRIAHYERAYETIAEDDVSYIKLVDVGRQVVINHIRGYLPGRLVFFLMNIHTVRRPIFLTRHGESDFNVSGQIGGDAGLSARGVQYAVALSDHLRKKLDGTPRVTVWTSSLRRAVETAGALPWTVDAWRVLDEIDAGVCDGMTYAEIEQRLPDEFGARRRDKLRYRYPRGESYQDVIQRLEPVIIEMERRRAPIVIVAHLAVIRSLYAYLMDLPNDECPHLPIPLHTVIQLTPTAYGYEEERTSLDPGVPPRRDSIIPKAPA
jgi:broad specificity phosphatase PhoE